MTITLEPEVEAMVRKKVQDGLYGDAQAVIRKALSLLDERDKLRQLRAKLQIAQDQLDRGEGRPFTPELFEELKQNALRKAAAGHTPNPDVCP